jgi:uncharacterized protein
MSESPVFMFDNSDPEMQRAYERARATFRYFWRELSWERRRIIPGLDLACVKAPFSDGQRGPLAAGAPNAEQMWLSEIDFDGECVTGVLLNSPNWVKSVKKGDTVRIPLGEITDWMYAVGGVVFGAHTVNLMRSRMGADERAEHDAAWGLDFGDPSQVRIAPAPSAGWQPKDWLDATAAAAHEHPMSDNMAPSLKQQLAKDSSFVSSKDDNGWTLLHHQALAGSVATVKVLLEAGADTDARTDDGKTPLQLAQSLGWNRVVALLTGK